MYSNKWVFKKKEFESLDIENHVGFVYLITNNVNNKKYIGKKYFSMRKTTHIKGKKKKTLVESSWKTYYGSSDKLLKDIIEYGKENFSREMLHICKTKSDLTYMELREQIDRRVLETEEYYNDWIMARVRKINLKLI